MDSSVGPLSRTRKAEGRGFKSLRARITPDYLLLVDDYHPLNHLENGPQPCRQYIVKHSKVSVMKDLQLPAEERSEEHTSELQSRFDLVCRLLLEKKK